MPRNPHHKARIRRSIVFEAARVLRMGGPEAIGVAAIMAKLGLTHGGFYAGHKQAKQIASCALATMAGAIGLSRTISDRDSSDALLGAAKAAVKSQLGLGTSSRAV